MNYYLFFINIETVNMISYYAEEDEFLFEIDRDEYIVDLTNGVKQNKYR